MTIPGAAGPQRGARPTCARALILSGLLIAAVTGPAYAQDNELERQFEELGERIGRVAERLASAVLADVAAAMEDAANEQRSNRQRAERGREDATAEFSQTHRLARDGTLRLNNIAGDVVISRGSGDSVQIHAVKRVSASTEAEARRLLEDVAIVVSVRGGSVDVRTEYPRQRNWNAEVDYTINVPEYAQLDLHSYSGNIRISGVSGSIRAETVSGDIAATKVVRIRQLKSISGDVTITDAEGEEFAGETLSGDAVLRNVKARVLEFTAVSGDLGLTDVEATRATLTTLSGNIDYRGRLARDGQYEMKSHSGNIRVVPADGVAFEIEATTLSGNVHSDYPMKLNSLRTGRRGFAATTPARSDAPSGNGALLSLQAFSGNITISKK